MLVHKGQKIVLCGPSGSGKSTLIRCINRLEEHDSGRIVVAGTELTRNMPDIAAVQSEIGMVFQQFNLFPHLTVVENLMLAPRLVRKMPRAQAREIAMHYLNHAVTDRRQFFIVLMALPGTHEDRPCIRRR